MPTSRLEALAAVEGERRYQDTKWSDERPHSPTEFLLYIDDYVAEAKRIASRQPTPIADRKVLSALRKVAAMAVACMEQNGVVTREEEGARPVGFSEA